VLEKMLRNYIWGDKMDYGEELEESLKREKKLEVENGELKDALAIQFNEACDRILKGLYPSMVARNKKLRRIERTFKLWASVINPDYQKVYSQIQQILGESDE
jgi:hypothetical protein